jgi:hypothetical protein
MNYCELLWITENCLNYREFICFFFGFFPYIFINYWIIIFFCWVILVFLLDYVKVMFFDSYIVLNYSELLWIAVNYSELLWITVNWWHYSELLHYLQIEFKKLFFWNNLRKSNELFLIVLAILARTIRRNFQCKLKSIMTFS